jgi:hypothetical protein
MMLVAISAEDLHIIVEQTRAAAEQAGELRPARIGPVRTNLPAAVRQAITEDLVGGEYRRASDEAAAGDPDLTQR